MSLQLSYSPSDDAVMLDSGKKRFWASDLESDPCVFVETLESAHEPIALEVLFVSKYLPLEANPRYCVETDTLTFGDKVNTATLIKQNDDLTAYWGPDPRAPDDWASLAISLRNVSLHLAPVIEDLKSRGLI